MNRGFSLDETMLSQNGIALFAIAMMMAVVPSSVERKREGLVVTRKFMELEAHTSSSTYRWEHVFVESSTVE